MQGSSRVVNIHIRRVSEWEETPRGTQCVTPGGSKL